MQVVIISSCSCQFIILDNTINIGSSVVELSHVFWLVTEAGQILCENKHEADATKL